MHVDPAMTRASRVADDPRAVSRRARVRFEREYTMRSYLAFPPMVLALALASFVVAGIEVTAAQSKEIQEAMSSTSDVRPLDLTAAQRRAIYQEVRKDKSKVAPSRFATNVGAQVPPMIELYPLPDDILADNPVTKFYQFTRVDDEVVLVDPTGMLVVAVIGPNPTE